MNDTTMPFHSKAVTTNQTGLHDKLDQTVTRHIDNEFQKPIRKHNLEAFNQLAQSIDHLKPKELILDSCCGTGMSTRLLANAYPEALVVGIDQSYIRLNKQVSDATPSNCLMLQANCEDIWRLCQHNNITFERHYILYPNPWPKSIHLKRRWHGHPAFFYLKNLSKVTELRSNWKLYLEEFQHAWRILTQEEMTLKKLEVKQALTLFERKYHYSQQQLFRLSTT